MSDPSHQAEPVICTRCGVMTRTWEMRRARIAVQVLTGPVCRRCCAVIDGPDYAGPYRRRSA